MRAPIIQLTAVTRENRLAATDAAKDAIAAGGGWIDDFQMFSNKMICIRFEVPAAGAPALVEGLDGARIRLDDASRRHAGEVAERAGEVRMTLQLTFIHDEPDLRREVLAVPG